MDIAPADLTRIRDLYAQGRYRQAYDVAVAYGPMRAWTGTAARLIGGRLAIQLGAPRLGRRMHLVAFRSTPAYPEAVYYHARYRLERFGPFATWQFLRKHPDWSDAPPELHGDWLALHGFVAARLRDFDRSERWLNRAEAVAKDRPWPCIERASAYEFADRLDDALAAARRSLHLQPWFRPGVQSTAHLLIRLGREREAVDFLTEASAHLESGLVLAQLAALQQDLGHHADACRTLARYAELSPLLEKEIAKWLAARRADAAYLTGDHTAAAAFAREVQDDFYTKFADRLESPGTTVPGPVSPPRSILPVDLTYDRTPPTVYDLLARHWTHPLPNPPADATPPHDGLPDAAERDRAARAGWVTREFTLSPAAASALVARGVPFVVTLVESGFSQPRLAVGTDTVRNTLFLADGVERKPVEGPFDTVLERFGTFGPRCLALVPQAEAARLDDLDLSDRATYDDLYAVQRPLLSDDRPSAVGALGAMEATFPLHRLTKAARLALARYDAHPVKMLAALDELLTAFPHESTYVLSKATVLRELNRNPERLALLEEEGSPVDAEPMLAQSLAQVLLPNPDRQAEADWLLRRSIRNRPGAAAGYYLLATQWWERREFDDATEVYRFACTLEEREEQFAEAYFRAARATEQVPEAVRLFQQRAGRAAVPTPAATRALYHALMDRDEPAQAAAALDQAIKKLHDSGPPLAASPRPDSLGELLLFRSECHAGAGRFSDADADLASAKPLVPAEVWHKAAAKVARLRPDLASAVLHYLEVLKLDPLSAESQRAAVALLADTDGRSAARTHLGQVCQRFPHAYPLQKLRAEFLSGDPDADADAVLQQMLDDCPRDAWALRQRALVMAERKQTDTAIAAAKQAGEIEPGHPWYYGVLGQAYFRADKIDDATATCREGLRANIDQEPLVTQLVQVSRGAKEKQEALDFLADELRRQPHTGEGLVAFVAQAHQFYTEPDDHADLLETLQGILDERPDLWHAWSVVVQQLAALQRFDEAHSLAREAAARFPLLSKLWLDLGQVCAATGNAEGRLDALREAVAVSPGWSLAARELAEALDDAGEPDDAVTVLERTAARSPLDPFAHGFLAERLWEAGRSREAMDRAKTAVRHEPGYDWAWHAVQLWAERLESPDEPAELARELTRERAGDPRVWLRLARLLHHPRHNDEVLSSLDRVVALDPKNVEAHDLKAERLAEMGRFDAAIAAAKPPVLLTPELPFVLQGRLAWVEAKRGNYAAAIPPMHHLVSVDPTYIWGWHQLAEWYNETGRPEGYLEAASELVRLQPHHPIALMMRGEAKLQTGDRDGGKQDLRDVLRSAPGYSQAAVVLFDAYLEDEEFREAQQVLAVLQEHADGPEVAVKQIQLSCQLDDADAAVRAFTEVCEGPGQSPFAVQAALTELRNAGWEDRAARVLKESWQSGGPFHPWAPLFWIDSPDGQDADPGERIRAADAVIKAYPKFMPGHDCKAEQLALAGRFDEALTATRPPDIDPPPLELRGRAAWVEARRGDKAKAISLMKQVVADEPTFVLGWRQLAAWYDATGRTRECLDAAEQFVKLEPTNAVAYVYRGEARKAVGDRRGSLADFQKAFEIDPSFEAAGLNLIAEQLAASDVDGAAATLTALREHADGPVVRLRGVQVACRQGEFDQALMHFRALASDPMASAAILRDAVMAFDGEGWGAKVTPELRDLAFSDDANPSLAGLWAERAVASGTTDAIADRLPSLLQQNPDAGREVVLAYVWALAEAGKPVQSTVQLHGEILRADDAAWARAGGALVAGGHFGMAVAWLADWREREGVEAWMLRPLTVAYRSQDQDDKAIEVCRAAVRIGGPDEQLSDFRSWLALDLALSGQTADASSAASRVDSVLVPDGTRLVLALAEALVIVQRAGPGAKGSAFAEAKDHLRAASAACASKDTPAGAGRAYRKVAARIAADAGTLGAKLWALCQRVAPWVR